MRVDPSAAALSDVETARSVIRHHIARRVIPSAVVEAGAADGAIWREAFGTFSFDADSPVATEHTVFDLASLTKPVATTSVILALEAKGALQLDAAVSRFFPDWRGEDRAAVTVRDLLEHASGLPTRLLDAPPATRREFEHEIGVIPLVHPPRHAALYSDLGFILLAFLAGDLAGSMDRQFDTVWQRLSRQRSLCALGSEVLRFRVPAEMRDVTAPTIPLPEDPRRGRILTGEVHDNYASALGGVAGHAGLFGNAAAVGLFARGLLRGIRGGRSMPVPFSPALVIRAVTRSTVPGSSRALGWDTMLVSSSCGTRMSPSAFGHVGFTGTSLWIDPVRDRYFVLLTNRVNGGGTIDEMRELRRAFHDALGDL